MKTCKKCKVTKKLSEFHKGKIFKDGHRPTCKSCRSIYTKEYYESHKNERKKYLEVNKDKVRETARKYNDTHKEQRKMWSRDWCAINRERINNRIKFQYHNNPEFKLRCSLRSRLHKVLKLKNIKKSENTLKLLGCSIEYFKQYLESKFQDGMTWDNYGFNGWHIDHIKPCIDFNLNDIDEQRKCFHYTNLQPLWAKDNFEKGTKSVWQKNVHPEVDV